MIRIGTRLFVLLAIVLAALGGENKPEKAKTPVDSGAVDKLIAQFRADSYKEREDAVRRLIEIGPPALGPLRRIAEDKRADPDVRLRAARAAYAIATVKIDMVRQLGAHTGQPNNVDTRWARRVAISPDGKHAVTAGWDSIRYWDLASGKQIRAFGANRQGYWSVSFSADGKRVLAAGSRVSLFDVNTGKSLCEMAGHAGVIWGAVLTPDGKQAISGAWDRSIRVWDTATGRQLRTFKNVRDNVRCMTLSPDGKTLAAGHFAAEGGPGTIRLWDVEKGTEIRSMQGHELEVTSVSFSRDGKQLLSSSFDKTVRLWNVADGKESKRLQGSMGRVEGAALTPDGQRVVTCGWDDDTVLRLWDLSSGKLLGVSDSIPESFMSVVVLPDGRRALTTSKDGGVRMWRWDR